MVVGELPSEAELAVVGGGPGGYTAAAEAARRGVDVTLIDEGGLGGTCLHRGCIPSKALLHVADVVDGARRSADVGVDCTVDVDLAETADWSEGVVDSLARGVEGLLESQDVDVVDGRARFVDVDAVHVEGRGRLEFERAILATGSRPVVPPEFDVDGERVLTSDEALRPRTLPDSVVVVGGGYIGMETATAYSKLGSDVVVLEALDTVLSAYGDRLTRYVERRARDLGLELRTGEAVVDCESGGAGAIVSTESDAYDCDVVVVAVGREPVVDFDFEAAEVEVDERGHVVVDEATRTSNPAIQAVGDVAGEPMLAHVAYQEGRVAGRVAAGEDAVLDQRAVPKAVFTDPELAVVGLGEDGARAAGFDAVVGEHRLGANGRAMSRDDALGVVRVVVDSETGFVLGGELACNGASELVNQLALAIEMGATVTDVTETVFFHPSLSEAVAEATRAVEDDVGGNG
ncbi:MAG: dihydrolipoyl dehydrogenase [Halobacteriales archaeon]